VIWQTSEGNPLYLGEIVSLLLGRGGLDRAADDVAIAIPDSIKAVIQERADTLHEETRELLATASVFGREFRAADLTDLDACQTPDLDDAIGDCLTSHLVEETAPGKFRFTHILVREVFHSGLTVERRRSLHLRWADRLQDLQEAGGEPRWSELAHHLSEAGPSVCDRAIEASIRAAEHAVSQLAYDDAAVLYAGAAAVLDDMADADPQRRCELLLDMANSQLRAGAIEAGRDTCRRVAEMARSLGDAELIARAALRYGSVFVYAEVDRSLVALLQEAADALDDAESGLRARVLARLAAALQPAPDTQQPIQLAREAIDMARRVGDPETLLQTIRAGCSAMMDLADPSERLALNREHVELADRLNDPIEALRGHMRTVIDAVELGQLAVADESIEACHRIAEPTSLPHHLWPVASLRAKRATMSGRFADAEQYIAEAHELSERAQDPNARRTLVVQRFGLLRAREHHDELLALRPELERAFEGIPHSPLYVSSTIGTLLARLERPDQDRPALDPSMVDAALRFGDANTMCFLAEAAVVQDDRELMARLGEPLSHKEGHFAHWGMLGLVWEGPVSRCLALIADGLGDFDRADLLFERALEQSRSQGAPPMAARTAYEHARSLTRRGGQADVARAASLLDESERTATALEMSGLVALIAALRARLGARPSPGARDATAPTVLPAVAHFNLRRDGESWTCECEGETFRLKDTKGVRMLARLVEHPGREFHVLDLTGAGASADTVDTGDAGEVLDDKARAAYRRRVEGLQAEIEEAETWNDPERAARAREELDLIATELSKAFGLGGRKRRAGSAAERARVNVQRRIRDAILRISEHSESAGKHLSWAVRTGTFCSYDPS
jgi:tetratricopeptide (TPR) repeat protein